jgi:hypothetical protein
MENYITKQDLLRELDKLLDDEDSIVFDFNRRIDNVMVQDSINIFPVGGILQIEDIIEIKVLGGIKKYNKNMGIIQRNG